jgi:NAD-dependent dihydropyrimidine dehydrogenase PreA subunit
MAIERIDIELCNGCGSCYERCPMDVIRMNEENDRAVIKYPEDCTGCYQCAFVCLEDAIVISPVKAARPVVSW